MNESYNKGDIMQSLSERDPRKIVRNEAFYENYGLIKLFGGEAPENFEKYI